MYSQKQEYVVLDLEIWQFPRTTNSRFWEFVFFKLPNFYLLPHYKRLTQRNRKKNLQRIYKLRKSAPFKNKNAISHFFFASNFWLNHLSRSWRTFHTTFTQIFYNSIYWEVIWKKWKMEFWSCWKWKNIL